MPRAGRVQHLARDPFAVRGKLIRTSIAYAIGWRSISLSHVNAALRRSALAYDICHNGPSIVGDSRDLARVQSGEIALGGIVRRLAQDSKLHGTRAQKGLTIRRNVIELHARGKRQRDTLAPLHIDCVYDARL